MKMIKHYQRFVDMYSKDIVELSKKHSILSFIRLLSFLIFAVAVYLFTIGFSILIPIGLLFLFIASIIIDFKLSDRLKQVRAKLQFNTDERQVLETSVHPLFCDGSEYVDPKHPYSFDIDLFGVASLFSRINRTVTKGGEQYLVHCLSNIEKRNDELIDKQMAIAELSAKFDLMQNFIVEKYLYPEVDSISIEKSLNAEPLSYFKHRSKWFDVFLYLLPSVFLMTVIMASFGIISANIPVMSFVLQLFYVGYYQKRINQYHGLMEKVSADLKRDARLLKTVGHHVFKTKRLQVLSDVLLNNAKAELRAIRSAERLLNAFENRLNVLITFLFNGIFLRDLWLVVRFGHWIDKYESEFCVWNKSMSELDAFMSLALYNFNHPEFVQAKISDTFFLDAEQLGHPLISEENRVANSFCLHNKGEIFIVTGANMSGKSTFLRTVLINLVLASTGSKVCATSFIYKPASIFSSIRTFDNLIDDVSYFQAELLRLKCMMEEAQKGEPVVIAIDEPLKGTNSEDKRKGSMLLLEKLIQLPVCGLVATHDLELQMLKQRHEGFKLICFELKFEGDKIIYDYKLRQGVTSTMNATILMRNMGLI